MFLSGVILKLTRFINLLTKKHLQSYTIYLLQINLIYPLDNKTNYTAINAKAAIKTDHT